MVLRHLRFFLLVVLLVFWGTGCPWVVTSFSVHPLAFDFGTNVNRATLYLSNGGSFPVSWQITGDIPPWLTITPLSGITTRVSTAELTVNRDLLTAENNRGSFRVRSSAGDFTVYVVAGLDVPGGGVPLPGDTPVLRVVGNAPGADDTHAVLQFGLVEETGVFRVENAGTGSFTWSIPTEQLSEGVRPSWLVSVTPTGGTVGSTPVEVTVRVRRPSDLAAGQHTYTLQINHTATNNATPAEIQLVINRAIRPQIGVDPTKLDFGPSDSAGDFYVANFGDVPSVLNFVVSTDSPCWLFVSPVNGSSRVTFPPDWQRIVVSIYRGGLPADAGGGQIIVQAADRTDVPEVRIPVSVERSPLSIEGALPWIVTPSQVRYVCLLRNSQEVPLVLPTVDIEEGLTIFENNIPIEITETNFVVTATYRINLVMVLDYSNSMFLAAQAATDRGSAVHADALHDIYLKTLLPQVITNTTDFPSNTNMAIVAFRDRNAIELVQDFTTDRTALATALQGYAPTPHGASTLLPAVALALEMLYTFEQGGTGNQATGFADSVVNAVLLVSDGRQTTPPGEPSEVVERAKETRARIFTLSWGNQPDQGLMALLAESAYGQFYPTGIPCDNGVPIQTEGTPSMLEMINRLSDFSRDMSRHYVVTYTTLNENSGVPVRYEVTLDQEGSVIRGASPAYELDLSTVAP